MRYLTKSRHEIGLRLALLLLLTFVGCYSKVDASQITQRADQPKQGSVQVQQVLQLLQQKLLQLLQQKQPVEPEQQPVVVVEPEQQLHSDRSSVLGNQDERVQENKPKVVIITIGVCSFAVGCLKVWQWYNGATGNVVAPGTTSLRTNHVQTVKSVQPSQGPKYGVTYSEGYTGLDTDWAGGGMLMCFSVVSKVSSVLVKPQKLSSEVVKLSTDMQSNGLFKTASNFCSLVGATCLEGSPPTCDESEECSGCRSGYAVPKSWCRAPSSLWERLHWLVRFMGGISCSAIVPRYGSP